MASVPARANKKLFFFCSDEKSSWLIENSHTENSYWINTSIAIQRQKKKKKKVKEAGGKNAVDFPLDAFYALTLISAENQMRKFSDEMWSCKEWEREKKFKIEKKKKRWCLNDSSKTCFKVVKRKICCKLS